MIDEIIFQQGINLPERLFEQGIDVSAVRKASPHQRPAPEMGPSLAFAESSGEVQEGRSNRRHYQQDRQ